MRKLFETITLIMAMCIGFMWFMEYDDGVAAGYGSSMEGDSSIVTYVHYVTADSAHCRFAFGEAAPYDSAFMYPVAGVSNPMLIADDKLNLDSMGTHLVSIIVYDDDVVIDTAYGVWLHDPVTPMLIDTLRYQSNMIYRLVAYWGACDSCYQIMWPRDGTTNKDSMWIVDPAMGNDSLVGFIQWHHSNQSDVYDSSYFYFDEPWK